MDRVMSLKPIGKFTTPIKCKAAREYLGLSKVGLANVLRIQRKTIIRIEQGQDPPGPYQVALEALVSGWRPWGVRLPIDKEPADAVG
jgi:DNA-binding XRE family transcriptional regulator